jgi:glycosyltransferase A (GT-A) superfamily protein (DUF2064 family)
MMRTHARVFHGIAMSTPTTGAEQAARLAGLGLGPALLPELRDVDSWPDALDVAGACHPGAFRTTVERLAAQVASREESGRDTRADR